MTLRQYVSNGNLSNQRRIRFAGLGVWMKRVSRFGVAMIAFAMTATTVHATTLENLSGTVRLNKGDGFKPMTGSERVRPGDSVMVDAKSKGTLLFSDGCSVPVPAGSIFAIPEVSPCSMTAQFGGSQVAPPPGGAPGGGGFGGAGGAGGGLGSLGGLAGIAGIAGAGAAGVTAAAVAANSSNQDQNQRQQLIQAAIIAQNSRPRSTP